MPGHQAVVLVTASKGLAGRPAMNGSFLGTPKKGALAKGKQPGKGPAGGVNGTLRGSLGAIMRISPLRAFLAGNLCLLVVMYCFWPHWRDGPRGTTADGHVTLHLGGPRRKARPSLISRCTK